MKNRHGHQGFEKGFALIGVMVLVGLLMILSLGLGALYLRQLDQQRQIQTQKSL